MGMSGQDDGPADGSSAAKAIVAHSIGEEYRTIAQRFPGCQFKRQELHLAEGRHYDVLVIDDPEGLEHRIWFDISRFFGKG